jgi:hypothetical protein
MYRRAETLAGISGKYLGYVDLGPDHIQGFSGRRVGGAALRGAERAGAGIRPVGRRGQNQRLSRVYVHEEPQVSKLP